MITRSCHLNTSDSADECRGVYISEFSETLKKEDYVIIQGNWGYVYKLVEEAKNNKIIPLYAFSIRDSSEEIINGEVVKIVKFKHQCFVEY